MMYMKRAWEMIRHSTISWQLQLHVFFSNKARSFNQWQRALHPNIVIINHSFRQPIGYLPRPKFIPHKLSYFLLFCCRSPKNRLKYRYRHNFSLYSPFLVLHSQSPINCSLFPLAFAFWLRNVPCSPLLVPCPLFSVLCSLFPALSSLFAVPVLYFSSPFTISCSPFTDPYSLFLVLLVWGKWGETNR